MTRDIKMFEARVLELELVLDQLLDDMGPDGLSVCQAAKDLAIKVMQETTVLED